MIFRILTALTIIFASISSNAAELKLRFNGFQLEEGMTLYLSLHAVAQLDDAWSAAVQEQLKVPAPLPEFVVFSGLENGDYAVRGFVDVNVNEELDVNEKNRPKEPFGFSYSASKKKPSLKFERAVISVPDNAEAAFAIIAAPGCKSKVANCSPK